MLHMNKMTEDKMAGSTQDVAKVLGLTSRGENLAPLEFAERVERGLPVASLDRLASQIAPEDMKFFLHMIVRRATLSRRRMAKDKRLSADESDKVARLARLWSYAVKVWGDEKEARRFLLEPHMLLDGRVPADMAIRTDEGARLVEDILGRLQYGSAA